MAMLLLMYYIQWHYGDGLADLNRNWRNFLWFFYNLFSIELLLQTLFTPFQRLDEPYKKGLDIEAFFSTLVVNLLMRVVGAGVRLVVIGIGMTVISITFVGGLCFFAAWVMAPIVVAALFIMGIFFVIF